MLSDLSPGNPGMGTARPIGPYFQKCDGYGEHERSQDQAARTKPKQPTDH